MLQKDADALLQWIQDAAGCFYLSDLHSTDRRSSIASVVAQIKPSAYSLPAWNGAMIYLFPDAPAEKSSNAAQKSLLRLLSEKDTAAPSPRPAK